MKTRLLSLSLLLFSFYLTTGAQEIRTEGNLEVNTSYADTINHLLEHLDKSKIPNHLLIDQAIEFTNLKAYNGTISDTNQVYIGNYKAIYNTLLMARTHLDVEDLVDPQQVQNRWLQIRKNYNPKGMSQPHIILSGLYYQYAKIAENALSKGNISVKNNQVFDVYDNNGNWKNPYEEHQVLAITPPVSKLKSLSLKVSLPPELWMTNQSEQVHHIEIDFSDGNGFQPVGEEAITVNYNSEGLKKWRYKLLLNNGSAKLGHTFINVKQGTQFVPWSERNN